MGEGAGPAAVAVVAAAIDQAIAAAEPAALDLLRQTIRTPSVSGQEGSHDDPASVAGQLWASLAGRSLERAADQVAPGRDNVVALIRGATDRVVVLAAHTDTVPPGDPGAWYGGDPYAAADGTVTWLGGDRLRLEVGDLVVERTVRARLGRLWAARPFTSAAAIYGRGSFDNKGPVAVAWLATVALAEALGATGTRLGGTLVCGLTVDEERGLAGVRALAGGPGCWLDRHGLLPPLPPDAPCRPGIWGVALDGSYGFVPVVGHRGIAQIVLRTRGQAAHAATPTLGTNAVTRMAAVLHALATDQPGLDAALSPLFADGLLEPASVALGTTIVGGGVVTVVEGSGGRVIERQGVNVVPDWCEATVDCRHPRPASAAGDLREEIGRRLRQRALALTGLPDDAVTAEVLGGSPPCAILARAEDGPDDPLVGPFLRHGAAVTGIAPWVETAPGGTDATVMIGAGIRSLVEFGPAGAFAHEPHEFVERDQIAIGARVLARAVVDLLGLE